MEKIKTLVLANAGAQDQVEKGRFRVPAGKMVRGYRARVTGSFNNTSGGPVTLSAAQKIGFLNTFQITEKYGADGTRQPHAQITGALIREQTRFEASDEVDRFTDATVGLAQAFPNVTITPYRFQLYVPLGRSFLDSSRQNFQGMGPTQCRTLEVIWKRLADVGLPANFVTSGAINVDIIPDYVSAKFGSKELDLYCYPTELRQINIQDYEATLQQALHKFLVEQTTVHTGTSITLLITKMDDEFILNNIDPQDWLDVYQDSFPYSGAQLITDTDTLLYALRVDQNAEEWPVGKLYVNQPSRQLNPMKLLSCYCPLPSTAEIKKDLQWLADNVTFSALKAVHIETVAPRGFPEHLRPFLGMALFDKTQPEFEQYPGWVAVPGGGEPVVFVPKHVGDKVTTLMRHHEANGEHDAAANVHKQLALAIPGAVQSTKGINAAPSEVHAALHAVLPIAHAATAASFRKLK